MWSKIIKIYVMLNSIYMQISANPYKNSYQPVKLTSIQNSVNKTRIYFIPGDEVSTRKASDHCNKTISLLKPRVFINKMLFPLKKVGLSKTNSVKSAKPNGTESPYLISSEELEELEIDTVQDEWVVLSEEFQEKVREDGYSITSPEYDPYAMFLIIITNKNEMFFCTGSLLTTSWVLTAAHCVTDQEVATVRVYAGVRSFEEIKSGAIPESAQKLDADNWFSHPEYQMPLNDVAVVQVKGVFRMTSSVSTIPLTTKPWTNVDYKTCKITGFGKVYRNKTSEDDNKRKTHYLSVKKPCECDSHIEAWYGARAARTFICSMRSEDYGFCVGDSGGSLECGGQVVAVATLMMETRDADGCKFVKTVTRECGSKGMISVFLDVCPYLRWINSHVNVLKDRDISPECLDNEGKPFRSRATRLLGSPCIFLLSSSSLVLLLCVFSVPLATF